MIAAETKVRVPAALKSVWRSWSLARRGAFLRRLRTRLQVPLARDRGPHSSNVTPFDYASPEAQALCAKLNDGTNSRTARCKIDLCSEGVIFEGGLWFWNSKVGYQSGPWHPGRGRLALHHVLWERWNGRAVPAALKSVWRSWSLARRGAFLRRMRARLGVPLARDRGPYSSNMTPFDYASPEAQALCAKLNEGTNSRTARCKIDLCSEGVIFEGGLWFWNPKVGYQSGPWHPGRGRLALHHVLWERWNGCRVPAGHVLRYRDGNPNNLVAANLSLVPRDELARENQGRALTRKSRALTKALLGRVQNERQDDDVLSKIRNRSAAA
jgi:hypothetical protein